jgi:hypothetical protein
MYLVLIPVQKLNGARSNYYEANYMADPVDVCRALGGGAIVYKLDALTEIIDIEITCSEKVINAKRT